MECGGRWVVDEGGITVCVEDAEDESAMYTSFCSF